VPDHGDQVTHHARQGAGRTLSHLGGDLVDGISMLAVSGVQSVGQREVDGDGIERDASDRGERGADPAPGPDRGALWCAGPLARAEVGGDDVARDGLAIGGLVQDPRRRGRRWRGGEGVVGTWRR
jgi:hypothetical protein